MAPAGSCLSSLSGLWMIRLGSWRLVAGGDPFGLPGEDFGFDPSNRIRAERYALRKFAGLFQPVDVHARKGNPEIRRETIEPHKTPANLWHGLGRLTNAEHLHAPTVNAGRA